MPTIVYRENPSNGVRYAYSCTSVWDKEKKAPRTKRTYLGRVDPDSGEIIPPSSRKKSFTAASKEAEVAAQDSADMEDSSRRLAEKDKQIKSLQDELRESQAMVLQLRRKLERIATIATTD